LLSYRQSLVNFSTLARNHNFFDIRQKLDITLFLSVVNSFSPINTGFLTQKRKEKKRKKKAAGIFSRHLPCFGGLGKFGLAFLLSGIPFTSLLSVLLV